MVVEEGKGLGAGVGRTKCIKAKYGPKQDLELDIVTEKIVPNALKKVIKTLQESAGGEKERGVARWMV